MKDYAKILGEVKFTNEDDFQLVNKFYKEFIDQYSSYENDGVNWYIETKVMTIVHFKFTTVHPSLSPNVKGRRSFLFDIGVNDNKDGMSPTRASFLCVNDIKCQIEFIVLVKKFMAIVTDPEYIGGYPKIGFKPSHVVSFS